MRKYRVKIVETLKRVVDVEAKTYEEAEAQVRDMYRACDIVLDSGDYYGTEFVPDGEENND